MLKNIKKIVICLIALLFVAGTAYTTFASESNGNWLNDLLQSQNGIISDDENTEQIPEGQRNNNTNEATNTNNTLTTGNTNTNTNKTENLPEKTPHAGLEDYSGLIFVAVFTVSAVYAYKKIREYNV